MSATRYYQLLNGLIESEAALAADPMLVKRLRWRPDRPPTGPRHGPGAPRTDDLPRVRKPVASGEGRGLRPARRRRRGAGDRRRQPVRRRLRHAHQSGDGHRPPRRPRRPPNPRRSHPRPPRRRHLLPPRRRPRRPRPAPHDRRRPRRSHRRAPPRSRCGSTTTAPPRASPRALRTRCGPTAGTVAETGNYSQGIIPTTTVYFRPGTDEEASAKELANVLQRPRRAPVRRHPALGRGDHPDRHQRLPGPLAQQVARRSAPLPMAPASTASSRSSGS